MFKQIISRENLRAAYLEIVGKFLEDKKNFIYHGLDNLLLKDYELKSQDLIIQAARELAACEPIEPALAFRIPKKSNPAKTREIFIYNIKERLKAQAIARVLGPEFEKHFSERLFSYRPGKPPYLASKNFCHRYRRSFKTDQALILDLENYSDLINKEILVKQLEAIFSDPQILLLLKLFIYNKVCRDGVVSVPTKGLIQGVPLIASFANLYLSALDFKYQRQVPFYLRVGDDLALLDKYPDKLEKIKGELIADLESLGLSVNLKKLFFGSAQEQFSFLGYSFHQGLISLEANFVRKTELEWKQILVYKNYPEEKKVRLLQRIMRSPKNNYHYRFLKIVKDKPQINDGEQIKKMSENFFKILTKFFYVRYSPRRRRLLVEKLKGFGIKSLYSVYKQFHYERD